MKRHVYSLYFFATLCLSLTFFENATAQASCQTPVLSDYVLRLGATSFTTTWTHGTTRYGYQFEYRRIGMTNWNHIDTRSDTLMVNGLLSGTDYEARVRSVCDSNLLSAWSTTVIYRTLCGMADSLHAQTSTTTAHLTWSPPPPGSTRDYVVLYRRPGATTPQYQFTANRFLDLTGLQPGTTYEFSVITNCAFYQSDPSPYVRFTTTCTAPQTPVAGSVTNTQASISWQVPSQPITFEYQYRTVGTSKWMGDTSFRSAVMLTGLDQAGPDYEFRVRSVCAVNVFSAWSPSLFFTALSGPGGPPPADNTRKAAEVTTTLAGETLRVQPNPATQEIHINYQPADRNARIVITSASGALVYSGAYKPSISVKEWKSGLYLVSIYDSGKTSHLKLVKQ
ncbi:MAG TPA: fibronectin type III domain-containing protein [Flavisolibacter sp.]|jgi:hypothetical protein|nr:fibronectin type III domain-containing protein [Flavisolibacter sp.]